ncbi:LysR substrate-binding domain-containing protein [Ponticoccus alexandrii]|uniref:LysR family transcriptional regulator n=1 Tax=Ponticoccus alexandrii TaxID=1943633 RepID=A0ABX7FE30_9RHOB|nr:LysR substrate-binding domain-containing protein [Ponticoccus alexandrii]ETA53266.1 LysR family transcriptional regulator [Rhodobacteraceae bacterium PD-2]QRF68810.1 LysR family transcriptional regulator [Ponticoccus alexandrii]
MDIRQLRYFVNIVECGSLSAAARKLHVAQPALSQQLARLEAEVGVPLLNRSSKGVTPTENGSALYRHGHFMLRQFDQSLEIARGKTGSISGVVTVGLPATTVAAIGLPLMRCVRERYPEILFKVVEGMSGHVAQMMQRGQLDIAVLFSSDEAADMQVEPLMTEELFLILSADSELVPPGRDSVSLDEVSRIPLVLPTRDHGLRQRIDAAFENRNLATRVVAQVDSLSLVMDCVDAGMGGTIKPMGAIMRESAGGRPFRHLSFQEIDLSRRNYLYSRPPDQMRPASLAVHAEIRASVHALISDGDWPGFSLVEEADSGSS